MFCQKCGAKIQDEAQFCGSCGIAVGTGSAAEPQTAPSYTSPAAAQTISAGVSSAGQPASAKGVRFSSYDQVPFYRKQWFFWLMYFTISPIAIAILLFGDVYYPSKGQVKSFGLANRIVAGIIAVAILWRVLSASA